MTLHYGSFCSVVWQQSSITHNNQKKYLCKRKALEEVSWVTDLSSL